MKYAPLIEDCLKIVAQKQLSNCTEHLQYHNIGHTNYVLEMATTIASQTEGVDDIHTEAIQLAAVFHDAVYVCGEHQNEEHSAQFAEAELKKANYPSHQIPLIKKLILATRWGSEPNSIYEKIIIDADLAHLHKETYIDEEFENLFNEINLHKKISKKKWIKECIKFLNTHKYHTPFAQESFSEGKNKNLKKLEEMTIENEELNEAKKIASTSKKKKKKSNGKAADRGIETLFRVTLRNHTNLSQIADNKANTLISVNAIIVSIILSTLFPKFSTNPSLIIPGIVLLTLCILTVVLAMVATVPRTTEGVITREDILNKKGNLAFFGNFHRMPIEDYEWGVGELMKDKSYLYKSLTRDLYHLGKVLKKKYFYLRIAYFSFGANLITSSLIFILSMHLNG
ncbi:Pycsar system effector family protein [Saccharicrinis aurantiacus]|uniref:Pycsar system effector family protein n=1 Tax=Saccharicrinis aurantiacus TaxID=1849719 RepID=UPI002490421C|nr:Pycsar system effector family protein [Saccharicrinis aurantiacus]